MFNKHNLKFGVISVLLTLNLSIGTLAMTPSSGFRVSESISGLKFKEKLPITRVGKGNKSNCGPTGESIVSDKLSNCIEIIKSAGALQKSGKYEFTARWIKHLHRMIITDCNCPSYNFIEKLELIPKDVDQSTEEKHCPYCDKVIGTNKYCSDINCISYWNLMYSGFRHYSKSLGNKSGWRERLCLLPAILFEICRDTDIKFYPPAKAWAIHQLMEGKQQNWKYVDKLFDGLSYSLNRVPKIKELLNSAYEGITVDDIIDACLYQESFE